jgi:DNA-binding NarL/FixJ family response regulator
MNAASQSPLPVRPWKIMLVDDHPVVRECLDIRISREPDLVVCASVGEASSALPAIAEHQPDLVIIDITLPDGHGLELVKDIHARHPGLRLLVFSMHDETLYGERMLRAGASGYVMKKDPPERVVEAVREILAGRLAVSDALSQKMLNAFRGQAVPAASGMELLSDRELEVFQLLGQGMGTREISEHLRRGIKTIETYRNRIKDKLDIGSASELVARAAAWAASRGS